MTRAQEIRELLKLTPDEVIARAGRHLVVCDDLDALHRSFAETMAGEIRRNNARGRPTRLIVPVGPTGQYPILAERINAERLSLADCWLFFMDEYCDESGDAVTAEHPLSFKREAAALFLDRLDDACRPAPGRVIFPVSPT